MKKTSILVLALLSVLTGVVSWATPAAAQDGVVYDRRRGEISQGAQAPSRAEMVSTIRSGAPTAIFSTLEYGERVECHECVPLLQRALLESDDASTREIAAWWLRRRPFGFGAVMVQMKQVLQTDTSPVRRARAAEALGEFMDFHGLDALRTAAMGDAEASVRASAVRAIARLNIESGNATVAAAFADRDPAVRGAALSVVMRLNFFRAHDAIIPLLMDSDAAVRRRAAQILGERRVAAATTALAGVLRGDADANVRQAAAWALGRIGGSDSVAALNEASAHDTSRAVLDAVDVARRMRH